MRDGKGVALDGKGGGEGLGGLKGGKPVIRTYDVKGEEVSFNKKGENGQMQQISCPHTTEYPEASQAEALASQKVPGQEAEGQEVRRWDGGENSCF